MSSGKRVAKTDGKLKKAAGAVWSFVKGYLTFSKLLVFAVLFIDYKATMVTLDLCYIAVANNYTGSLPYSRREKRNGSGSSRLISRSIV